MQVAPEPVADQPETGKGDADDKKGEDEKKGEAEDLGVPEPGSPEYWKFLTKAIFAVGLNKCITPSVLIISSAMFLGIDLSETATDCLQQMAGGLLIYTWGAKCMVPVQEAFQAAFVEKADPSWGKKMIALTSMTLVFIIILGPLFYLATEGHDFSKVDGGIVMFGVLSEGEGAQCTADGKPLLNITQVCHQKKPTRPGSVHSPVCHGDEDSGGATGMSALLPYFIGFALDAIMLVLVEPEEELVEMYAKMRISYKSVVKDLLVSPIAFSLDNFLTGAGVVTVVNAATGANTGASFAIFVLFASFTAIGVVVAFLVRGFQEVCERYSLKALGLWVKFAFLLIASLSFLDNGTDLVKEGLTFWVGIGAAIGWLLFAGELLDGGGEDAEES